MTLYTTTISTAPTDFNGNTTSSFTSEAINNTKHVTSEDFNPGGVQVIDKNGDRKAVLSTADFADTDVVNVAGIPMTVAQARAAGINVAVEATAANSVVPQAPGEIEGQTEEAPLDTRTADDGHATDGELAVVDNVVDAVQLHTGMDREATLELGKDILTGQLANDDQVWASLGSKGISQDAARASVGSVVQAGQSAAMKELGDSDYRELSYLADNSAAIKAVVINHGIKRMAGKAKGVTWKHVLTLARQFARA
jgi:hypothetical protein